MSKTLIDLDDELLAEAAVAFGTTTKKETVNEALRRAVADARARRKHALARLQQRAQDSAFGPDLPAEAGR